MKTKAIILAGGKGTRMLSDTPKTLHRLFGKTMIQYVVEGVLPLDPNPTIVVGYKGEEVIRETEEKYSYVRQKEQLGTGHAVGCAKETLLPCRANYIVVVPGDAPLLKAETLRELVEHCVNTRSAISLSVASVPDFDDARAGFLRCGRIFRNEADGNVRGIVEWKDTSEEERHIREINAGFYCFRADFLWENIDTLESTNAAKEFYLTDLVARAVEIGEKVCAVILENPLEGLGVNTKEELLTAERAMREL